MKKAVVYVHGKGGNPSEAEFYRELFPDCDVFGLDYRSATPEQAKEEFPALVGACLAGHSGAILIANSIGAYFCLHALSDFPIERAFFISPVVDMEGLIGGMMASAGVTEKELKEKGEIATPFHETLSWAYYRYVREHPIRWKTPTEIAYGERDDLTPLTSITAFAERTGANLTVMKGGEHWFHTQEQMCFLKEWIREKKERL